MKKIILPVLALMMFLNLGYTFAADVVIWNEDTQLLDLENWNTVQELKVDFKLQKFNSCDDLNAKMKKFIKEYYEVNWGRYRYDDINLDDTFGSDTATTPTSSKAEISAWTVTNESKSTSSDKWATDFSQTNIQVKWVDESEIVKTDGKYIYFYNELKHSVIIAKAFPAKELEIVKTIKVPANFTNPELYLDGKNLIIVANKYTNWKYDYYWFNRNQKTVVVGYDVSDLNNLKLTKFYQADGNITQSRKIGKYVYILSQSSFAFPYNTYYGPMYKAQPIALNESKFNSDFAAKRLLPTKAEVHITDDVSKQNVKIGWKKAPYNLTSGYTSKCADIEFVLPDLETMKKIDFSPSYVTLSIIDTENPSNEVKSRVLFGDVNEIHMSLENLYITSNIYTSYDFKCPQIQCIKAPCPVYSCSMPYYYRWENTLIHKIKLNWNETKYENSTIIPGSPLTQYSMDENNWEFRIVTKSSYPERHTNVYVLDKNLAMKWKLEKLAKDENFQSSRFIWDKLYLVTFKQIDPLFVIDLKDSSNPKVLGELKIPGYSTYLHPYDETHLIWIGYDTKENKWWGTQNNGLKIDLYDVTDLANPKQQYTLTMGDYGSFSEVLNNPRLFVWDDKNKTLYMNATIYKSANDTNDTYRHSDVFQGSVAIKIDKDSWIKELARVTHIDTKWIEEKRLEECKKYVGAGTTPKCEKLIGWGEYCPPVSSYVPPYCYESSTTWEYLANQIWNYSNSFVIRNLYMDNYWFTLSNTKIQANDISSNFDKIKDVEMK